MMLVDTILFKKFWKANLSFLFLILYISFYPIDFSIKKFTISFLKIYLIITCLKIVLGFYNLYNINDWGNVI